jgi:uncharacterized OB-fold protein
LDDPSLDVDQNIGITKARSTANTKGLHDFLTFRTLYQIFGVRLAAMAHTVPKKKTLKRGNLYPPVRPSASAIWRDRDAIFRLHAGKCRSCGSVQYPPQRICSRCKAKDSMEPVRLSDRKARIFTYTLDNLAQVPAYDLPIVDSILDFEGGGRGCFLMTDRDPREVKVGLEVEMTFRRMHTAGGMNNYFWKCTPVRAAGREKESK